METSDNIDKKNKENLLNKKVKRNFHSNENNLKRGKEDTNTKQSSQGINKFTKIESLYNRARELYEANASEFDLDRSDVKNKEKKWTADILKSGTFEDKISALALYIKKSPYKCLKYLDMLIKMARKKNRRQTETCVVALKDLFLEDILTNKKLTTFYNNVNAVLNKTTLDNLESNINNSKNAQIFTDEQLLSYYIEDFIHRKYFELIEIVEDITVNDPLKAIKKKFMNILLEMLIKKPEREEKLLDTLINKLGDPEVEIVNLTIKLLNDLQNSHPKMSLIIMKNVQNFISKSKTNNQNNSNSQFYSLVYLCGMSLVSDKEFIEVSLNYFFDLFNYYSKLSEENFFKKNSKKFKKFNKNKKSKREDKENNFSVEKILSLIVKRVNKLCLFSEERNIQIKKFLDEKIDTLFKLSHSESVKLRIEVLKLIFTICHGIISGKSKNRGTSKNYDAEINLDRYYKSLYELILSKDIFVSKNLRDLLKLIVKSLSFDQNTTRVAAFLKRLLQMSMHADPSFISCVLIIVSQLLRNRNKLWRMVDKNSYNTANYKVTQDSESVSKGESLKDTKESDLKKRDPKYTNAEILPVSELTLLSSHYHPTVQKFSKFILENYNKDIIDYNGDPLIDFSLINFLEKFMLKNPKIKKEKKEKNKVNKEEEELKKFMEEDDDINPKIKKINEEDKTMDKYMHIDFISKFNEIEKTKSVKYEINQKKKEKKKIMSQDVDEFADKIIDEEYEKYDKDVDEHIDLDEDEEFDGEDEENIANEDEDNFDDDEEEIFDDEE